MSGAALIMMATGRQMVYSITVGSEVVGADGVYGYSASLAIGAIAPTALFAGNTIVTLAIVTADAGSSWVVRFSLSGTVANTDAAFTSLEIGGDYTSGALARSAASYSTSGGASHWDWSGATDPSGDSSWTLAVR